MGTLEDLNDRQRAILQLLLTRDKTYEEIAELLKSDRSAIQARAQEAVAALGPDLPDIGADRRSELADYLLGQQTASRRAATREYLEDSATGRTWARPVATALRPLAGDSLPDVPAEPAEVEQAFDALDKRTARQAQVDRSSQLGTRILFVAGGLVLAVVLIVVLGIFSSDDAKPTTATIVRTTPTTTAETPQLIAEGDLRPPKGSGASARTAIVRYKSNNKFKLLIVAKGMTPAPEGSAYGVWFYTSSKDRGFVGFPKDAVSDSGGLNVVADLTPQTRTYREVLITRETTSAPKHPGNIVLRGELVIAKATQTQPTPQTQTQTTP